MKHALIAGAAVLAVLMYMRRTGAAPLTPGTDAPDATFAGLTPGVSPASPSQTVMQLAASTAGTATLPGTLSTSQLPAGPAPALNLGIQGTDGYYNPTIGIRAYLPGMAPPEVLAAGYYGYNDPRDLLQ